MRQYNYKCVVNKNGIKMYYEQVKGKNGTKWKRISNKAGKNAEKRKRKYNPNFFDEICDETIGVKILKILENYHKSVLTKPKENPNKVKPKIYNKKNNEIKDFIIRRYSIDKIYNDIIKFEKGSKKEKKKIYDKWIIAWGKSKQYN